MDILEGFGKRVRERRSKMGVSQEKFAAKCKLDRTYISGIERGKRNLSLRNIKIIADALDTTISELTKGL
jgi:transcriptional regulator with XRE-family HTH domain